MALEFLASHVLNCLNFRLPLFALPPVFVFETTKTSAIEHLDWKGDNTVVMWYYGTGKLHCWMREVMKNLGLLQFEAVYMLLDEQQI